MKSRSAFIRFLVVVAMAAAFVQIGGAPIASVRAASDTWVGATPWTNAISSFGPDVQIADPGPVIIENYSFPDGGSAAQAAILFNHYATQSCTIGSGSPECDASTGPNLQPSPPPGNNPIDYCHTAGLIACAQPPNATSCASATQFCFDIAQGSAENEDQVTRNGSADVVNSEPDTEDTVAPAAANGSGRTLEIDMSHLPGAQISIVVYLANTNADNGATEAGCFQMDGVETSPESISVAPGAGEAIEWTHMGATAALSEYDSTLSGCSGAGTVEVAGVFLIENVAEEVGTALHIGTCSASSDGSSGLLGQQCATGGMTNNWGYYDGFDAAGTGCTFDTGTGACSDTSPSPSDLCVSGDGYTCHDPDGSCTNNGADQPCIQLSGAAGEANTTGTSCSTGIAVNGAAEQCGGVQSASAFENENAMTMTISNVTAPANISLFLALPPGASGPSSICVIAGGGPTADKYVPEGGNSITIVTVAYLVQGSLTIWLNNCGAQPGDDLPNVVGLSIVPAPPPPPPPTLKTVVPVTGTGITGNCLPYYNPDLTAYAGSVLQGGVQIPAVQIGGTTTTFPATPGSAVGIDDSKDVLVDGSNGNAYWLAYNSTLGTWSAPVSLTPVGDTGSYVNAMNTSGLYVGYVVNASSVTTAAFGQNGNAMAAFSLPSGPYTFSIATGVNDSSWIAGWGENSSGLVDFKQDGVSGTPTLFTIGPFAGTTLTKSDTGWISAQANQQFGLPTAGLINHADPNSVFLFQDLFNGVSSLFDSETLQSSLATVPSTGYPGGLFATESSLGFGLGQAGTPLDLLSLFNIAGLGTVGDDHAVACLLGSPGPSPPPGSSAAHGRGRPGGARRVLPAAVQPQQVSAGEETVVLSAAPTPARVTGFTVSRHGHESAFHWRLVIRSGVAGFDLYAGEKRLNRRLIRVHASPRYSFTSRVRRAGPFSLRVVLADGSFVTIAPQRT